MSGVRAVQGFRLYDVVIRFDDGFIPIPLPLPGSLHDTPIEQTIPALLPLDESGRIDDDSGHDEEDSDTDTTSCCRRHAYCDYDYRGRPEGNRLARYWFPVEQAPTQRTANRRKEVRSSVPDTGRNRPPSQRHPTNNQKRQCYGQMKQGARKGRS